MDRTSSSALAAVRLQGDRLVVEPAPGVNPAELLAWGAKWSPDRKSMSLPASAWALEAVNEALGDVEADTAALSLPQEVLYTGEVSHLHWNLLFDYQKHAVRRLLGAFDAHHGLLLAMSPGLGKTATSIVAADTLGVYPIVVCPASLVATWYREIDRWSIDPSAWTVISYERFVRHGAESSDLLILDESIMIKSHRAKRTKKVHDWTLGKNRRYDVVWCLSGNPVSRYPDDLWAQLRPLRPKAFTSYWRFAERYCHVRPNDWGPGKVVDGPKTSRDARFENRDLIHAVNQEDVLDLPEYLFEAVDVTLTTGQRKAYDTMLRDFYAELEGGEELTAENKVARLIRLQQIVSGIPNGAKHDALVELVKDEIYELPLLVWTHWREQAARLAERLGAAHVSGTTPPKRRDEMLKAFADGELPILVLSLGVGKFGHTFTKTKTVAYVDKTFAADDYVQSLRRVRRIGLGHHPVVVTFRAPGTTDDLIERNLEGKLGAIARMTNMELTELLRGLGR